MSILKDDLVDYEKLAETRKKALLESMSKSFDWEKWAADAMNKWFKNKTRGEI